MAAPNLTLEQRFSEDTLAQLKASLESGAMSLSEAGRALGVSKSTIRRWADRSGVKPAAPSGRADVSLEAVDVPDDAARVAALEADLALARRTIGQLRQSQAQEVQLAAVMDDVLTRYWTEDDRPPVAPYVRPSDLEDKPTAQHFLAHLSDTHYGEVVNPELAMGLEYDPDICIRRLLYWRDKVIRYADLRPYDIDVLHVAILGDMVSGENHDDLAFSNARDMFQQMVEMADVLHQITVDFAGRFPQVKVYNITGNHGRLHKVPRHKARPANFDWGMGAVLERTVRLAGLENVTVENPRGARHIIDVAGKRIALMHGDGVKAANFAGIPFYSMKSKHDALQGLLRALQLPPVDQISMGHFHQHLHWPGIVVVNGSVKGGDEYVQDTRLAHTPASQLVQEWHPKFGLTTSDYISLDHIR